jgi:hypothetical protein
MSPEARKALQWWLTDAPWKANGNEIVPAVRPVQTTLRTDAATHNAGHGGVMTLGSKEFKTRGCLTEEEQREVHVNQHELMEFENTLCVRVQHAVRIRPAAHPA